MSRTVTTTTEVFTFEELSPAAQERACQDWSQFLWDDGEMAERCEEIWHGMLEGAGWTGLRDLRFALHIQHAEPAWSGHRDGWLCTVDGYRYDVVFDGDGVSLSTDDDPYGEDATPEVQAAAGDMVYALRCALLRAFEEEDEYMSSPEEVADSAEANGYEYNADGSMA
jgi:hypothetical protein